MLVLGIDPGTARTGYGLVRLDLDGTLELLECGVLTTASKQPMHSRLLRIYQGLRKLLETYKPDEAAVENLFFQKNVSTAISVGQARGVVLLALAQAGLPVGEYSPQDVKQAVTGYGAADKGQMQRMVQTLLSMDSLPKPDDIARHRPTCGRGGAGPGGRRRWFAHSHYSIRA